MVSFSHSYTIAILVNIKSGSKLINWKRNRMLDLLVSTNYMEILLDIKIEFKKKKKCVNYEK